MCTVVLEMQRMATPMQRDGGRQEHFVLWGGNVKSSGPREGWIFC